MSDLFHPGERFQEGKVGGEVEPLELKPEAPSPIEKSDVFIPELKPGEFCWGIKLSGHRMGASAARGEI
jgi:hypothetical protein